MKLPELNNLLAYENPAVLKLYVQNYPANKLSAPAASPEDPSIPPRCIMLRSMREIDEMWHEFILFTKDYTQFCQLYFGEYLHHLPNIFDNMPISREAETAEITILLPYIYDHLGEETMHVWFAEYLQSSPG